MCIIHINITKDIFSTNHMVTIILRKKNESKGQKFWPYAFKLAGMLLLICFNADVNFMTNLTEMTRV